jgi:hypothetical protein
MLLERPRDDQADLLHRTGLGEVVVRTVAHGLDRRFGRAVGRQHDHQRLRRELASPLKQLETVRTGHADVADHQLEVVAFESHQRLFGSCTGHHLVTFTLQQDLEEILHAAFIIDDQDSCHVPASSG